MFGCFFLKKENFTHCIHQLVFSWFAEILAINFSTSIITEQIKKETLLYDTSQTKTSEIQISTPIVTRGKCGFFDLQHKNK